MLIKRITREELLQQVDSNSIFNFYFGPFEPYRKSYPSIFRKDSNPSTGFFINADGEVVYSDLATGEKWGAIAFVAKLFNLGFQEAIDKIAEDFGIKANKQGIIAPIAKAVRRKLKPKQEKIIKISTHGWNEQNLAFWKEYEIYVGELKRHDIYPIANLYVNDYLIPNENSLPRYAFHIKEGDKEYMKIYSPYDSKEKKWLSNSPLKIPFGYKLVEYKSNRLIITKSMKDMIVCKKFFPDVIALQNESPNSWNDDILNPIVEKFEDVLIWFDNDKAGLEALNYYKEKGFSTFHFPVKFLEKHGVKDPADFIKKWGSYYFKVFLKQNGLINE